MAIYYRYNDRYTGSGNVVIELDEWHSVKETECGHWCVRGAFNAKQAAALLEDGTPFKHLRKLHNVKLFYKDSSSRFAKPTILRAAWHFQARKQKQMQILQYQLAKCIQAYGAMSHTVQSGTYGTQNTAYEIDAGEHDPYRLVKIPDLAPRPPLMSRWAAYESGRRTQNGYF